VSLFVHIGEMFVTLFVLLFLRRVNTYTAINAQAPFGGYKMSGQGRELYVNFQDFITHV